MYDGTENKIDSLSAEINQHVANGEYEFLLEMAGQKDSLPDIRQAAKDNVALAAVIEIINKSAKKEFKPLLKMSHDKRLTKDIRRFAEMEAESIIAEEIKRCVSNGWYKLICEVGAMGPPKNSKKAIRDAIESAAIKAIELCIAANWQERIVEISRDRALPYNVRELARKVAEAQAPLSCKDSTTPPVDFLRRKNSKDKKERGNWQARLRRILRY